MKYTNKKFKLDNSAIVYPSAKTKKWTAMFRLSVSLKDDIDVEILKEALKITLKRLPSFSTTLKKGCFWHYIQHIEGLPKIEQDVKYPMESLNIKDNNGFLFRVRVNKNTVAFEYFHALTDGSAGMKFLLTTVKEYLTIKNNETYDINEHFIDTNVEFCNEDYQDDFHKFARKSKAKYKDSICYVPKSKELDVGKIIITSHNIKTETLKKIAKQHDITIGGLLTSMVAYSFYKNRSLEKVNKPIKVAVPVNLRNYYPSKTFANFTTFVTPGIDDNKEYSFKDVVNVIKNYLKTQVNEAKVNSQFSKMVALEKNFFLRYIPLFIKIPVMRKIYLNQNRYFSTTFSNLGNIVLPEKIGKEIESLNFMLGQASIPKSIGSCVSYNGTTTINFSRTIEDGNIEKEFFAILKELENNIIE